jgi:sucrose-6-phosphate hydrolase SacC (GH32 family)
MDDIPNAALDENFGSPPGCGLSSDCLEIVAEFDPGDAEQVGLRLRCTPDGSEQTVIAYNRVARTLFSATTRASHYTETVNAVQLGPFELAGKEPLKLQILIDASVIEVFANGRACPTERAYPARKESLGIGLFARGGKAQLRSMEVWPMTPISRTL